MALQHFLLVYDLNAQRLIDQLRFDDGDEAARAYSGSSGNTKVAKTLRSCWLGRTR